jgi:hypothetical protein
MGEVWRLEPGLWILPNDAAQAVRQLTPRVEGTPR